MTPRAPASRQCAAITGRGTPCPNAPSADSEWCGLHDPEIGAEARRAGGVARAASLNRAVFTPEEAEQAIRFRDPKGIPGSLEQLARAMATGKLDHSVGNAIVTAANAAIRATDSADLAKRLELIEGALGRRKKTP